MKMKKNLLISLVLLIMVGLGVFIFSAASPSPEEIDVKKFQAFTEDTLCADLANQLYKINNQYVFWHRAGNCPDNGYSDTLYGKTPQEVLCFQHDSIAGPVTDCSSSVMQSMFDTILKNLDKPNLGLSSSDQVIEIQ